MQQKDKRVMALIVLLVIFTLHMWGVYVRKYKIDSDFLNVIVQQAIFIDTKYTDQEVFSIDDSNDFVFDLDSGHRPGTSDAEFEIVSPLIRMADAVYEMSNARINGDAERLKKEDSRYQAFKDELKVVLEKVRKQRSEVEILWEKGFFK